jgi:hypothetical protein
MKHLISLLSDIQDEIESTDNQQAGNNGSEFENGADCGRIEGTLATLKKVRSAVIEKLKEIK